MKHSKGKKITSHFHKTVERQIQNTLEVLVLKKGNIRVDFYDDDKDCFH